MRLRRVDQVDPHAHVLVEHAGAVVPIGERVGALHRLRDDVDESQARAARSSACPFGLGHVGGTDERGRVPHVGVGRRDVEVAADSQRSAGRDLGSRARPSVPRANPACTCNAGSSTVRPFGTYSDQIRYAAAGRADRPGLRIRESGLPRRTRARHRRSRPGTAARRRSSGRCRARRPGNRASRPRPAGNSAVFVSCRHTTSGLAQVEPLQQAGQAGGDRVDVPRSQAHATDVSRRVRQRHPNRRYASGCRCRSMTCSSSMISTSLDDSRRRGHTSARELRIETHGS